MKKISLSVLVLWVAIGVSLSAIYVPILSDSQELLINTLNSATGNILGNNETFSIPIVSLLQGEFDNDNFGISTMTSSGELLINQENTVKGPISQAITVPIIITNPTEPTRPDTTDTDTTINPPAIVSTDLTPVDIISPTDTTPQYINRMIRYFARMSNMDSRNKYLVNNFNLNIKNFTVEITNQQDRVTGDGYYEIKSDSEANHDDVLQSGTFPQSNGIVVMSGNLTFTPENNTQYHILVYTNYPEDDNRVSKADTLYVDSENDDSEGPSTT